MTNKNTEFYNVLGKPHQITDNPNITQHQNKNNKENPRNDENKKQSNHKKTNKVRRSRKKSSEVDNKNEQTNETIPSENSSNDENKKQSNDKNYCNQNKPQEENTQAKKAKKNRYSRRKKYEIVQKSKEPKEATMPEASITNTQLKIVVVFQNSTHFYDYYSFLQQQINNININTFWKFFWKYAPYFYIEAKPGLNIASFKLDKEKALRAQKQSYNQRYNNGEISEEQKNNSIEAEEKELAPYNMDIKIKASSEVWAILMKMVGKDGRIYFNQKTVKGFRREKGSTPFEQNVSGSIKTKSGKGEKIPMLIMIAGVTIFLPENRQPQASIIRNEDILLQEQQKFSERSGFRRQKNKLIEAEKKELKRLTKQIRKLEREDREALQKARTFGRKKLEMLTKLAGLTSQRSLINNINKIKENIGASPQPNEDNGFREKSTPLKEILIPSESIIRRLKKKPKFSKLGQLTQQIINYARPFFRDFCRGFYLVFTQSSKGMRRRAILSKSKRKASQKTQAAFGRPSTRNFKWRRHFRKKTDGFAKNDYNISAGKRVRNLYEKKND